MKDKIHLNSKEIQYPFEGEYKIYGLKVEYDNFYELLSKALIIYSVINNLNEPGNHLRPRLSDVLSFYVLKGYSEDTKKIILDSKEGLTRKHLNQINSELQRQGYLHKNVYNEKKRDIDKSLILLRDYISKTKDSVPVMVLKFSKNAQK